MKNAMYKTVESFWEPSDYVFYAGPYPSDAAARQSVYRWVSNNEMSYTDDNPVVYRRAVYVRNR